MTMVSLDDFLAALAAVRYRELEIERMINPKKVEEYYPEDPFDGLTAEEIEKILARQEIEELEVQDPYEGSSKWPTYNPEDY